MTPHSRKFLLAEWLADYANLPVRPSYQIVLPAESSFQTLLSTPFGLIAAISPGC